MSVGPTGVPGSVAGSPLAQTRGPDLDRAQQDRDSQARRAQASQRAEHAGGIGQTEQDHETSERDADGRRLWERSPRGDPGTSDDKSGDSAEAGAGPASRDATGERGNQLDVSG